MAKIARKVGVSATLLLAAAAYAQPANDLCTNAQVVAVGTTAFDNTGAGDETTATCAFNLTDTGDVWFSFTPTASGPYNFTTDGTTGISDTVLSIYDVCGGTQLACDDDSGAGLYSTITAFNMTAGTPYIIRVAAWGNATVQFGAGQLTISGGGGGGGPANDQCANAEVLNAPGTFAWDNTGADADGTATCTTSGPSVWFRYNPIGTGVATFNTEGSAGLTDTVLSLFDACGGTQLACDDDAGTGFLSSITYNVTAGVPVWIRASGFNGATGSAQLNVIQVLCSGPVANDTCATPTTATIGTTNWDNTCSVVDGAPASCGFNQTDGKDVWFNFTPATTGTYQIDTDGSAIADTTLAVYDACGGTEIACDDDAGTGLQSKLVATLTAGVTYKIRAAAWGTTPASGAGVLNIQEIVLGPGNTCATALSATLGDTAFDNSANAATSPGATCAFGGVDGAEVWFNFTPSSSGTYIINTNNSPGLTDTTLQVFDSCGGLELACDDDSGNGLLSQAVVPLTAGTTYKIRVAGWGDPPALGDGVLTLSIGAPPPPGDSCATALVANAGANSYDNTGATNDGLAVCAPSIADIWYVFTPSSSALATIDTFGSGTDTILAAYDSCGGTLLACNDDFGGAESQIQVGVTAGSPIYIRVSNFDGIGIPGPGTLNINLGACTTYTALPGSPEGEVCGTDPDTFNGGCNSTPNVYSEINCGDVINGTTFWDLTTRDTDWYRFTVTGTTDVRIQAQAQFPAVMFLLQDGAVCTGITLLDDSANAPPCAGLEINATVPAGSYRIFFSVPFTAPAVSCGVDNNYWLTLATNDSATCDRDFNNDCLSPDSADLDDFIAVLSGGPNSCSTGPGRCDSIDFNGDTLFPDSQDLDDFVTALAGACPP